ncbi:uncharacterized protein LOC128885203 isoform X1 [Hylaeus volcanicus]|uniref:uncharacterized protein LOC128885203 isoform X1 n=2 Tax=Hylaeus volcanicus TaxID=313075 RepID=UPI0023B7E926|nr:uncharacterized protein LOC128885203 isoform X1 [Hylaeus volcanicus]
MLLPNKLMSALYFEIFLWNINLAEWIEMPQFSDEKKIYRIPFPKQDQFYTFSRTPTENQFPYEYQNVAHEDMVMEQIASNESTHVFSKIKDSVDEPAIHEHSDEEDAFITESQPYNEKTFLPTMEEEDINGEHFNETLGSNDVDILKYLPVDVLKNVHQTLKSQPATSEGKILFLRTFKKTLMTEIESQLAQTIPANREKRGTDHYDHSYDYHEHATGFPSIEGALMAISFLTFAVYLVRLVMLLFRNMNNSASTTAAPTLLLGRRKKSINLFDEDTIKILNSVDNFFSRFQ